MSYSTIVEYRIIPTKTFKIFRRCAGCGGKQIFSCKDHFRVNANGNRLDVWLIYGCEKCGHTYNLPVYERISPAKIPEQEYYQFLSNDKNKVFEIGTSKELFKKNRAEIVRDDSMYDIVPVYNHELDMEKGGILIKLHNPYNIPIRNDKVVAGILRITRSEAKRLLSTSGKNAIFLVENTEI